MRLDQMTMYKVGTSEKFHGKVASGVDLKVSSPAAGLYGFGQAV